MSTELPVYIINGFLESGKTKFIQEMLEDKEFNTGEKTLLLICEEGVEEYDPEQFWGKNVYMDLIEDPEDLTVDRLTRFVSAKKIERLIVEYNGMWPLQKLYDAIPDGGFLNDHVLLIDATTFINYNNNMRQMMVEKLTDAEFVLFNRCVEGRSDIDLFHKIVRTSNRRCQICYEYSDGKQVPDEIEDPLPFDINAPVIVIDDRDYALWYRDLTENMQNYDGKTVRFKGVCAVDRSMSAGGFVVGRHVMTCCAADIRYMGLVAQGSIIAPPKVKNYDWVNIEAKIAIEKHSIYHGKGPVLHLKDCKPANPPAEPVATFY